MRLRPKKGQAPLEAEADLAVEGTLGNACVLLDYSKSILGELDLTAALTLLRETGERVNGGARARRAKAGR